MCAVLNRPGWFRSILGERGRTWPRCFFELDVVAAGLTFVAVIIETDIAKSPSCESKKAAGCNMQASRPTYRNPTAFAIARCTTGPLLTPLRLTTRTIFECLLTPTEN